jgi:3-oxoacyl-[acyl-carrier-protein] synthase-3
MSAYIKAISHYLPSKIFSNEDFFSVFPESVAQKDNYTRIGVKQRRIVAPDTTASDLATEAARTLFSEHQILPSDIDFLLFCALEFDHTFPASVSFIQEKLGLPTSCGALDYSLGCSGYVYGLSLAKGLVESVGMKNVLLLTSSTLTKKIHEKDRSSRFVFGDAAAATLIAPRAENGISSFVFGTDGKMAEKIIIRDGGARHPISPGSFTERENEHGSITTDAHLFMDGAAVFHFGLKTVPQMIKELLEKEKMNIEAVDLFIFHQANLFLIDTIRTKMKIPEEKVFNYMAPVGNTVAASIPITLEEAIRAGKAKPGQNILLAGFGVGLSWAATIVRL